MEAFVKNYVSRCPPGPSVWCVSSPTPPPPHPQSSRSLTFAAAAVSCLTMWEGLPSIPFTCTWLLFKKEKKRFLTPRTTG